MLDCPLVELKTSSFVKPIKGIFVFEIFKIEESVLPGFSRLDT
jgi:hypothetical protein